MGSDEITRIRFILDRTRPLPRSLTIDVAIGERSAPITIVSMSNPSTLEMNAGGSTSHDLAAMCFFSRYLSHVLQPKPTASLSHGLRVPLRYHDRVAMNLRLMEAEADALRAKAEEEGRSMQEVARAAITEYVSGRPARLRSTIERVRREDRELLDRLSR